MRSLLISGLALISLAGSAVAEPARTEAPKVDATKANAAAPTDGKSAFLVVHEVLLSPRCMNCHPDGDRPLQTDASVPHAMNISRQSEKNGLHCSTCHSTENSEPLGVVGPPGAPNWHLPPEDMPLVFQGRTPAQLCAQLKDPNQNGHKTLAGLVEHVGHDPLVLWGWKPGGARTTPPVSHEDFVKAFKMWVESGAPCPE